MFRVDTQVILLTLPRNRWLKRVLHWVQLIYRKNMATKLNLPTAVTLILLIREVILLSLATISLFLIKILFRKNGSLASGEYMTSMSLIARRKRQFYIKEINHGILALLFQVVTNFPKRSITARRINAKMFPFTLITALARPLIGQKYLWYGIIRRRHARLITEAF